MAPSSSDLADRLSDRFETRVKVDLGQTRAGSSWSSPRIDDLERIVALMAPDTEVPDGLDAGLTGRRAT